MEHEGPVPDLGAYTATHAAQDGDDALFAELDREVELLNEADADDAAEISGGNGRDADGNLAEAFQVYRAQRMAEIEAHVVARRGAAQSGDGGKYREVRDEKELLDASIRQPKVVIHFAHKDFRRCAILDRHFEHPRTLFAKADVRNTPFLVEKLGIKVLPCILAFRDGVCQEKLIGFEEFGNADSFSTAALEWRLGRAGVIQPQQKATKPILGFGVPAAAPDEDVWDD